MRSSATTAVTLALAALAPCLHGCGEIAGIEDREVIPLIVIAENQTQPHAIALDEEAVYWTNLGNDGTRGEHTGGSLRKQIKDEREIIDLLAPSGEAPYALALDATHIYWSLTDNDLPRGCADTNIERDKLRRLSKQEPFPATYAPSLWGGCGKAETIAVDATRVYGARPTADRVTWVPKEDEDSDGKGVSLETNGDPTGVATDGARVYWTDSALGRLAVTDPSEADPETITVHVEGAGAQPGLLVMDDVNLYWLTEDSVLRSPRSPSPATAEPVVLRGGLARPAGIAAHGEYLYVTDAEEGAVYQIHKDQRVPTRAIAEGQDGPTGIAADDTGVYWVNKSSGEVVRFFEG
ncbi:hypothetical protein SOCEGT47_040760 [Sorangium cellulosum]|uniref:Uncharacterized protein n=1 Tax=Sorangium cellulosum TaxID=56 RepID=A0A4P2Q2Q6_SORCE|nr:hypothetical protein [Sorangium cellulosum]AUX23549.1 hypothetical protein SOCEGT47_040760 [Sorangium cellulosum]